MAKYVCQTYLKGLKQFHFKLFLALTLASGATRPCLGVSELPLNPQFQGLKIDLCSYCRPNYFSRSAPDYFEKDWKIYYKKLTLYNHCIIFYLWWFFQVVFLFFLTWFTYHSIFLDKKRMGVIFRQKGKT